MVGYRSPVYGELIWENMLHTMEHFASNYAPVNPTEGQIWYDTLNQQLKLYDSADIWQLVWPISEEVVVGPNQPATETGLLWHSTTSNQLRVCDTTGVWQLVWPISEEVVVSYTQPATELGLLWHDTSSNRLLICDNNLTWQVVWPVQMPTNQPTVWVTNPNTLVGAGICLAVGATGYTNGVAIFRGRDFATEVGSVDINPGNPPAYLTYSYTNPTSEPVLLEADLTGNGNLSYNLPGSTVGFVYNIGENLNITMPTAFNTSSDQGTMRQDIDSLGLNTRGAAGGTDVYTEETVSGARFVKILNPGQTVTIYAQWWCVLYQSRPWSGLAVIHGNMGLKVKATRGGAYL
jgi:hypothetical protein